MKLIFVLVAIARAMSSGSTTKKTSTKKISLPTWSAYDPLISTMTPVRASSSPGQAFAAGGDYYKHAASAWTAFKMDLIGNTPGWTMTGTFGTRMLKKKTEYEFLLYLNVSPPTTYVSAANNVFQMFATFTDWDLNTSTTNHINNSVLAGFHITGSDNAGWTTVPYSTRNFCSGAVMSGKQAGSGFKGVTLVNTGECPNAWSPVPDCTY